MFKIRKKFFPETGYEICEKKYQEFLVSKQEFLSEDLFILFQFDCFHDGNLKSLRYCYKKGYIDMALISPNFLDDENNYVNITFFFKFHDIRLFKIKKTRLTQAGKVLFLHMANLAHLVVLLHATL